MTTRKRVRELGQAVQLIRLHRLYTIATSYHALYSLSSLHFLPIHTLLCLCLCLYFYRTHTFQLYIRYKCEIRCSICYRILYICATWIIPIDRTYCMLFVVQRALSLTFFDKVTRFPPFFPFFLSPTSIFLSFFLRYI